MSKRKYITEDQRLTADAQIKSLQRQINYDTKDYTVELVVQKFKKDEFFIPDYQRGFVWKEKNKSSFIESVLLGLPIPFMFFADCEDGKLEIIDGAQRVQTLVAFVTGKLVLSQLPKLSALHGFRFDDLSEAQKRRFWNRPLRIVVLEESTPKDVRQDIFNRINTSGIKAKESEIRRGSYPGRLTDYGVRKSTRKIADEIKNLRVDIVHGHAYYYDFANDHNIQYYMLMLDKLIERMNLKLVGFNDEEIKTFCSY